MINRDMKQVSVVTYTSGLDSYGQRRQNGSTTRQINMFYKISSQYNVDDPRYVGIDMVGLTMDKQIDLSNRISIDNVLYDIKYIIPSGKYNQVLMKKYGN